jgi:acyl-coenzyme A synthetase/AMP-(fatty) acid ligase
MLPLQGALTLAAGCPLLPQDLLAQLSELPEPAWWMTTPLHLRACLDSGLRFPALAGIVCATQTLDPALAQAAEACFQTRLLEIYGCTEVGMVGLRRTAQTRDWQLCADLELTPGTQPMRVTGVRCGAAQVLHDRIELLPNRQFRLHGRAADLIKIGGKRMHLDALNRALLSIPGVHDGVFFQPAADARLLAFAVAPTLDRAQILAALRERIDAVFLPRPLHLLDALPRNAVGKLPQQALLELAARDAVAS